jgi:hypothetical protein
MMLMIRREQMEMFSQAAVRSFEVRMVNRLNEYFPRPCAALGEAQLRYLIRFALERAKSYGITYERGVSLYLDLMFILGQSFDTDPQLPWTAEILNDETIPDETLRTDHLYNKAMDFIDQVAGVRNEHVFNAMLRIRQEPIAPPAPTDAPDFYGYIVAWLNKMFPEKCMYIGEISIRRLIQRGLESARCYGITSGRGVAIYVGLMFMLGSGFDTDLQFTWAAAILKDETIAGQTEKVERLYTEAIARLEELLPESGKA